MGLLSLGRAERYIHGVAVTGVAVTTTFTFKLICVGHNQLSIFVFVILSTFKLLCCRFLKCHMQL